MREHDWRAKIRGSGVANAVIIVITVLAIGAAWFVMRQPADDSAVVEEKMSDAVPGVGEQAPDFTVMSVDGEEIALTELAGRPVWLVFMATWCSGCRSEMPDVQATHAAAGDDGVQVVVVFVNEGSDVIDPYSQRLGLTMARVPDASGSLSSAYGVAGLPTHFFLDANGVVGFTRSGVLSASQIEEALATVR